MFGSEIEAIKIRKELGKTFQRNNRTVSKMPMRFFEKIGYGMSECWYWIGNVDALGYGRFHLVNENKAHRVSWTLFNGKIPKSMKILHRCDVRCCVNPEHLFMGTQLDNVHDMIEKNRHVFPERKSKEENPMSKLSQSEVNEIRLKYIKNKNGYIRLSREYGVSPMTIKRIITNQTWV